jgi:hypothetical protein
MREELEWIMNHTDKFGTLMATRQAIDDAIAVLESIKHPELKSDANELIKTYKDKRTYIVWELEKDFQKETEDLLKSIGRSISQGGRGDECMVGGCQCDRYFIMSSHEEPCNTCFKEQFKTGEYKSWTRK